MGPEPFPRELADHAKWAVGERNRLKDVLHQFETRRESIGDPSNPMNTATCAHIAYLRSSIDALARVIAVCTPPEH